MGGDVEGKEKIMVREIGELELNKTRDLLESTW